MAIISYSLCSATLLLANKMAIEYLPYPSVISFVQILFSTVTIMFLKFANLSNVDWFEWDKVRPYLYYVILFVAAIYTNMKALSVSNVETVIVFRACSPIAVCIVEYFFMNRELPNLRSSISLGLVAAGAMIYCYSDSQLALHGLSAYYWVIIYFLLITLEMTYGKVLISSVKMESVWGPALYCNALSVVPMFVLGNYDGKLLLQMSEISSLSYSALAVLLFSCIVGTLIG
jgi:drug/metabolite transporter (DMT)-like permease